MTLYLAKSKSYEYLYYAVFSNILLFRPSPVQIFSSAPYCESTSAHVCPLISDTEQRSIRNYNHYYKISEVLTAVVMSSIFWDIT
jgi:hypothetical protein